MKWTDKQLDIYYKFHKKYGKQEKNGGDIMKQPTREEVREFVQGVPLEIHIVNGTNSIGCVGIKWGFCKYANENYGGKKRVMYMLDLLETDYQDLLD